MSLTWSALPIAPDEDFDGARHCVRNSDWTMVMVQSPEPPCTPQRNGVFEAYLNGNRSPTMS